MFFKKGRSQLQINTVKKKKKIRSREHSSVGKIMYYYMQGQVSNPGHLTYSTCKLYAEVRVRILDTSLIHVVKGEF